MSKIKCALIGSGNIGTDLLIKIQETSSVLEAALVVGIDPNQTGYKRRETAVLRPPMRVLMGRLPRQNGLILRLFLMQLLPARIRCIMRFASVMAS